MAEVNTAFCLSTHMLIYFPQHGNKTYTDTCQMTDVFLISH